MCEGKELWVGVSEWVGVGRAGVMGLAPHYGLPTRHACHGGLGWIALQPPCNTVIRHCPRLPVVSPPALTSPLLCALWLCRT